MGSFTCSSPGGVAGSSGGGLWVGNVSRPILALTSSRPAPPTTYDASSRAIIGCLDSGLASNGCEGRRHEPGSDNARGRVFVRALGSGTILRILKTIKLGG